MITDTNAQYTNPVTDEERALIADFIAKNGVTKVARGVSGLPDPSVKMHWKDQREIQRRVYMRKRKFESAGKSKGTGYLRPTPTQDAILSMLQEKGPLKNAELAAAMNRDESGIRKSLRLLIKHGKVERTGQNHETRYRVAA